MCERDDLGCGAEDSLITDDQESVIVRQDRRNVIIFDLA